mgnify:CR=1 FL=1
MIKVNKAQETRVFNTANSEISTINYGHALFRIQSERKALILVSIFFSLTRIHLLNTSHEVLLLSGSFLLKKMGFTFKMLLEFKFFMKSFHSMVLTLPIFQFHSTNFSGDIVDFSMLHASHRKDKRI